MGGSAISQRNGNGQGNTQTGHLDRRTLLHKRYLIQRTIGQGGMGAVYQAKDLKRQTICAIKEMSLSMVPAEERQQAIQNFKIEAKILWGLNHPNLPAFHGFFTENQRYFMVMEYIDGHTLEELLERNGAPFSERRVLGWARQLCDVLEYLHSQNPPIIFRDMKPGNIMLTRDGRIKLIDFGIARFFRPSSSQDTQLLGTPGFAPPEQYGKAQTDERSDIYSLAMTLFQLLTNTLSETGFGVGDVRAINPQVSQVVARALEKATSLKPEERYDSVAAFRRALLGVGTFVFENGDQATTPEELADLCARYPEEASDYLASGEIESWLLEIGESDLARAARRIRSVEDDPMEGVEQFLQAVMGANAHIRGAPTLRPAQGSQPGTPARPAASRNGHNWLSRKPTAPVQVSPRTLDFGQVYPGISAPLVITIAGNQGLHISGVIHATEPWLLIDQTQFDGMSTRVNVRVNSSNLRATHYTGTILVSPDDEDEQKDIVVTVDVDVLGYTTQTGSIRRGRGGKTIGADLDDDEDDEDDDALTMGSLAMMPQTLKATNAPTNHAQAGPPSSVQVRDKEYKAKYGQPGSTSTGWDPLQASPRQRLWLQRGLTFASAFMSASFFYTILSHIPSLHALLMPPGAAFALVLAGMVPLATLGALLVDRPITDMINRACTGMASALLALALVKIGWQVGLHVSMAPLQLFVMLLVASLSATVGVNALVSGYIAFGVSWALARMRQVVMTLAVLVGGGLGFLLTTDVIVSWFTPCGILLGVAVLVALVWRVDQLMKRNNGP